MSRDDAPTPSLRPLFPFQDVARLVAAGPLPADATREGHVWPVAVIFDVFEIPAIIIEVAFWPPTRVPEPLTEASWSGFRDHLGLPARSGATPLQRDADAGWQVEFGPHTRISTRSGSFQILVPRADEAWEQAVRTVGSCMFVVGTGLATDDESGAVAIPPTAAAVTATYTGSFAVPELSDIPGLFVVPVNSLRPYDPMRAHAFVLDTDVLIEIRRFCFDPSRGGERADATRNLLVNLLGRDVFPGPALSQLAQPRRTSSAQGSAVRALAAFEHVMSLTPTQILDLDRSPPSLDAAPAAEIVGADVDPQMAVMYAGVLRIRQLWSPDQTLAQRAESFESFLRWMRGTLGLNAGLLVQVAFNLWMSEGDAHRQASRLLRFRARGVTEADLGRLWGTAFDLALILGYAVVLDLRDVPDAVILTFDRGLAQMRLFFEHVDASEAIGFIDLAGTTPWNARLNMQLHPGLEHLRPRIDRLFADLHEDVLSRLSRGDYGSAFAGDLQVLVREEERLLVASGSQGGS